MRLTHLANQRVIIARLTAVSGDKYAMSTVTAALGHIQPLSREKAQFFEGVTGKAWRFFCDADVDIAEGDRLKDENNVYYTVANGGVTRWQMGGIDYYEVVLTESEHENG